MQANSKTKHRIYTMAFARVYPEYVKKAERKGLAGWISIPPG